ncbi:hypothetical protein [Clostridium hydrogenum]|uniref:hypothetical protein n=1 Tax=Clostridium hydrogenum TaxID=2855764 RepID=UPI001F23AF30|nr:hypothetical protein [Clostridium hydrogenum]
MLLKNKFINVVLKCEIKIYAKIGPHIPFLAIEIEKNIKWIAKNNFKSILNKIKSNNASFN